MVAPQWIIFKICCIVILPISLIAQQTILTEGSFKLPAKKERTFDFEFNKGDKVVLDMEVMEGNPVTELEFIQLGGASRFMEYKIEKLSAKTFLIDADGKYRFRLVNDTRKQTVCSISIRHIKETAAPATTDTQLVVDQVAKVAGQITFSDARNWTIVTIDLPANTIAWSYYIGVGKKSQVAYVEDVQKFLKEFGGKSEIAALVRMALWAYPIFQKIQGEDNVRYWFMTNYSDVEQFNKREITDPVDRYDKLYKNGNIINDSGPIRKPLTGKIYLVLLNDNAIDEIDVMVKVVAITSLE